MDLAALARLFSSNGLGGVFAGAILVVLVVDRTLRWAKESNGSGPVFRVEKSIEKLGDRLEGQFREQNTILRDLSGDVSEHRGAMESERKEGRG